MDLLHFTYTITLEARYRTAFLDVLMVVKKFDVTSCINHCRHALHNSSPITIEYALLYL